MKPKEITVGQRWKSKGGPMEVIITSISGDNIYYTGIMGFRSSSAYFLENFSLIKEIKETETNGVTCNACNEYYEYAIYKEGFICYGCKSGH